MIELLIVTFVLAGGGALSLSIARGFGPKARQIVIASYGAHALSAFVQVWIYRYLYGYGDMLVYHRNGMILSDLMRYDFTRFFPDVVSLVFHGDPILPVWIFGAGSSTGTMSGLAGILCYVCADSLYAVTLVVAIVSFVGKVWLYRALAAQLPRELEYRALIAGLFVPSVVFWSSGLLKESFAIIGMGLMMLGIWTQRSWASRIALVGMGTTVVMLVKAYVCFAMVPSIAVWFYWKRAMEKSGGKAVTVRPVYLVAAASAALLLIVALGRMFPEYALENLAEHAARQQTTGSQYAGASNYQLVEVDPNERRSFLGQLQFAPLALLTALFRPFLFESRNIQMAINALETTALMLLFLHSVFTRSWVTLWARLRRSPTLMFCLTFTLTMGVSVGLASTNLGTLSRYRMPMIPFFAALVLVWTYSPRVRENAEPDAPRARERASTLRGG